MNFSKEMKKSRVILAPSMLPIHFKLFTPIFAHNGYKVEVLTNESDQVREEGLAHVHNDTCYPALLVIGQFIDALKSGKYDLNQVALAITQTGGGCRASNYLSLLRKAIAMEGWEDTIPCISVNFSGLEKDSGIEFTLPLVTRLVYGLIYGDALMWIKNQVKPYEINPGDTDKAVDKCIDNLLIKFDKGGYRKTRRLYQEMIDTFKSIPIKKEKKIRVGIVGEIYMKYSPLGNNHLEDYIIEEGFEPVLSGVMDFMLYCIENGLIDNEYYNRNRKKKWIFQLGKCFILNKQREFRNFIIEDGTYIPPDDFDEVVKKGKEFIDRGVKMGEGWLLTSEVVSLIESGVTNVISAQPFGCLPNHIVAKGMMKKIKQKYPKSNVVAIDYDPSASKVNQENRIRLMLANAKLSEKFKKE